MYFDIHRISQNRFCWQWQNKEPRLNFISRLFLKVGGQWHHHQPSALSQSGQKTAAWKMQEWQTGETPEYVTASTTNIQRSFNVKAISWMVQDHTVDQCSAHLEPDTDLIHSSIQHTAWWDMRTDVVIFSSEPVMGCPLLTTGNTFPFFLLQWSTHIPLSCRINETSDWPSSPRACSDWMTWASLLFFFGMEKNTILLWTHAHTHTEESVCVCVQVCWIHCADTEPQTFCFL